MPQRSSLNLLAADPDATGLLGQCLARTLPPPADAARVLTLGGELGAGKTTLARALLRELGVTGTVKSPTYTLVEPYQVAGNDVYHLDLYRLEGADELEALGWRDWLDAAAFLMVEWPERAGTLLLAPDLDCRLTTLGDGRAIALSAATPRGEAWLGRLAASIPVSGHSLRHA